MTSFYCNTQFGLNGSIDCICHVIFTIFVNTAHIEQSFKKSTSNLQVEYLL